MKTGIIFDIKEFAVFDGPGARQTVFLKGCPLRCSWCHNPEGLRMEPELMVSKASCVSCGSCETVCMTESCNCCGACIPVCPLNLRRIAGEAVTPEELEQRLRRNSDYYAAYGGGVTFSGGEPLMQADFLLEVLERLPDLHRAIETSGYCDSSVFKRLLGHLDYVMMDIKLFDDTLHQTHTGVSNRKILENARILCDGGVPFVIRIPVIPGVNDSAENFRRTAEWIAGAPALQKVELLPYHRTAGAKYAMVSREYRPTFDPDQNVRISAGIFQEYGIRSEIL